jgi:N-ethylmaleimide reductase
MRAVTDEIGGGRTGMRLSPVTPANDVVTDDPQALFEYVLRQLAPLKPGLHAHHRRRHRRPARDRRPPFDYAALKTAYRTAGGQGAWMVNNGYDKALAEQAVAAGADLVAFGKLYIANPDLVRRLHDNAPLNTPDKATFYGGGAKGYTDYPTLA